MARYNFVLMHGKRDAHGTYEFEGPADLMDRSPMKVMREAMAEIEKQAGIGHIDYELFSALKDRETNTVTALGNLIFHEREVHPFTAFVKQG